jgi:hypothetical protein
MAELNSLRTDEPLHGPTHDDFAKLNSLIAEAIVLCEVAQHDFVRIHDHLQRAIQQSRKPPARALLEEERARRRLFDARVRLLNRLKALKNARRVCAE